MNFKGRDVRRILVRATNWVGDALLMSPALSALKENFPGAEISVLARPWVAPVFAEHPAVHEVLVFDGHERHKGLRGLWRLAGELRRRHFDLAVLFQNAFQAALIARLAGIPLRMGYDTDGRGFLLNVRVKLQPGDKMVHETEYYLRMLAGAGLVTGKTRPVFYLSDATERKAAERLESLGIAESFLVGLAPGAAYGTAKQYPADRFAAAADLIMSRYPGAVLLFGSRSEAPVTEQVARHLKSPHHDLAGRTDLAEAAALIKRCHLFLTNDSGLMHVAAAVGTPLTAVFGPTNPVTTSPVSDHFQMVRRKMDCAPCLKQTCPRPDHECMNRIAPEEVAEAGLQLLDERKGNIHVGK